MIKKNNNIAMSVSSQISHKNKEVGQVKNKQEKIQLEDISARWAQIFQRYNSLGIESISDSWFNNFQKISSNPFTQNQRVKLISGKSTKLDNLNHEDLKEIMDNPDNHEQILQGISLQLYYNNYIYQTLIQLNRHTPKYNYYAVPMYLNSINDKAQVLKREGQFVDKALKKLNPALLFKTIATQVQLYGKCSYFVRLSYDKTDVNYFLFQKIKNDMIKITGFGSKQQFTTSFNMALFLEPSYDISQYPQFIQDTWKDMIDQNIIIEDKKTKKKSINLKAKLPYNHILEGNSNGFFYWVKLPQGLCYTFYSDGAHANVFPDTVGLFTDLNDLADYRWLQGNLLSKGVNSILTAEVPLIKDPKAGSDATVMSPSTILGYANIFENSVSANIFPFFAPFKEFELHSLDNQPESMNIIYNRIRDLIATSGNSALLSITDKPSIASVKAAEALQAAKNDYLTRQFEQCLNNVINETFSLQHTWEVHLWGDIFYEREDKKDLKEMISKGAVGLIPKLLSADGITLETYKGAESYLKALNINFKPETKAGNTTDEKKPVGRPKLKEDDINNDNTGISRNQGNNVSEIKTESFKEKNCSVCGRLLKEDEQFICQDCLEKLYDERIKRR